MEDKSVNIEELLTTYLEGECSEEEKIKALEWINSSEENKNYFFELKSARNLSVFQAYPEKDKLWNKIQGDLSKKRRFDYRVFLRIAAVFIIAIGLGVSIAISYNRIVEQNSEMVLNETNVPYGGKAEVKLSDGTVVHLNSGSKFSYPSVFGKDDRTVYLEGEAFFKVKTNKEKPFIVNTKDATIKAYGTEFNVNAYEDEPVVTATLVEGIISVVAKNQSGQEIILKPKEHAIIQKNIGEVSVGRENQEDVPEEVEKEKMVEIDNPEKLDKKAMSIKSKIDTDLYTSWKDDSWIIENESLKSLSKKLERRYDVDISFSDIAVENLRFTGRIVNEPLEQVLLYISLTASLNHKIEGRKVELYLDTTKIDYKTLYQN